MKLSLAAIKNETSDIRSFIFEPAEELRWQAGQYCHWVLHHRPTDDRGSDRWFTIASAPHERRPMITTRLAAEHGSSFKRTLTDLKVGDEIEISSCEGDFTVIDSSQPFVFMAGGIGVTPFRSILLDLDHRNQPIDVTLLYANRSDEIPYRAEFDALVAKHSNLKIHYLVSPKRLDEANIRELVPDLVASIFYVSGPEPMVDNLGQLLIENLGVPNNHLKQDWFPGYPAEV